MDAEELRLLQRIAKLSGAINKSTGHDQRSSPGFKANKHKIYVRPQEAPANVAAAMIPVSSSDTLPSDATHKPLLKTSRVMQRKPAPKPKVRAKKMPLTKDRTVVFGPDQTAYRKTSAHVLERREPVQNKTLTVPREKKRPRQRPTCSFFLRGECTKEDCPFSHVNVARDAPPCDAFLAGYCEEGDTCRKRHVLICDFRLEDCPLGASCKLKHRKPKQARVDADNGGKDDDDDDDDDNAGGVVVVVQETDQQTG